MADYDSRKRKPPEYPRKGTIHMKKRTNTNPMRRLLSLALSIVMVLSLLPAGALAEEPVLDEPVQEELVQEQPVQEEPEKEEPPHFHDSGNEGGSAC